jgi:CubicO group peptidase (beta-lactamase class C family)
MLVGRMKLSYLVVLVLASGSITFPSYAQVEEFSKQELIDELESFISSSMFSYSISVINNNQERWEHSAGTHNGLSNGVNVDSNTIYMIGSITKTITTLAVLLLVDSGDIDLDEDINNYLDFDYINPHYPEDKTTLRMLLSHKSGILPADEWFDLILPEYGISYPPFPKYIPEYFHSNGSIYSANNWHVGDVPGNAPFNYCGICFSFAAYIVEQVTGQTAQEYIEINLFEKIGIENMRTNISQFDGDLLAFPSSNPGGFTEPFHQYSGMPGQYSSTSDLAKIQLLIMDDGMYNGERLISKEQLEIMRTNLEDPIRAYGLGWDFFTSHGKTWEGHNGGTAGFRSAIEFTEIDGERWGYSILMNSGNWANLDIVKNRIAKAIVNGEFIQNTGDDESISISFSYILVAIILMSFKHRIQLKKNSST